MSKETIEDRGNQLNELIKVLEEMKNKKNYKSDIYCLCKLINEKYGLKIKKEGHINSFLDENNLRYMISAKVDRTRFVVIDGEFAENPHFEKKYYAVLSY